MFETLKFNMMNLVLLSNEASFTDNQKYNVHDMTNIGDRQSVGGGEILNYVGNEAEVIWKYMNKAMIDHFENFTLYKIILCLLIILIAVMIAVRILGIRSIGKDEGVRAELDNVKTLRRTEANILAKQRRLIRLKSIMKAFGLEPNATAVDYMNYNLKRAGILNPSGDRALDAYEFNAYVKTGTLITAAICILIMIFSNLAMGAILLSISLLLWGMLPNTFVRSEAVRRDKVIRDNFFDFYAEIHYILKDGGQVPLAKKIRAYSKSVRNKPEMVQFADNCAELMDTYGEYQGTLYIAKEYKEIPEVGKLMRLIRQLNDNADISKDLDGFREQLMVEKQLKMEAAQKKLIEKARWSFNILLIVLVQAILSAMAIYLPDLGGIGSIL